jgi:sugar lactone lactonase YvrE
MTKFIFYPVFLSLSLSALSLCGQNLKMYISDAGNFNLPPWKILKFDADGSNGEIFISDHLAWPQDILFLDNENTVLISNFNTGEIVRFDAITGDYKDVFAGGLGQPTRMKFGPGGFLYVLQWSGTGTVRRYLANGEFVDNFTSVKVPRSIGFDWDQEGNLYVSSYDGFVQKFSPAGADMGKFISTNLAGPTNIWFDQDGNLLVMDYNGALVKRFDSTGTFDKNFISGVSQCEGVDFLPNGNILIGVGATASVRMYTSEGALIKTIVPTGTLGLKQPNAVVLHEEVTTGTSFVPSPYKEMNIVHPSIGTDFQLTTGNEYLPNAKLEVVNASGIKVAHFNLADSPTIDASGLPDGIYVITLPLNDGLWAQQRIVVQH